MALDTFLRRMGVKPCVTDINKLSKDLGQDKFLDLIWQARDQVQDMRNYIRSEQRSPTETKSVRLEHLALLIGGDLEPAFQENVDCLRGSPISVIPRQERDRSRLISLPVPAASGLGTLSPNAPGLGF